MLRISRKGFGLDLQAFKGLAAAHNRPASAHLSRLVRPAQALFRQSVLSVSSSVLFSDF
jgi:hypothetical protein